MTDVPTIVYELALRSLDQQERELAELRSRTNTVIAAAALIASFLGAATIREAQNAGVTTGASAHTLGELVLARVLQGLGGSMLLPIGRLAVLRSGPLANAPATTCSVTLGTVSLLNPAALAFTE